MKKEVLIIFFLFNFLVLISFTSACEEGQIDINSASVQELDKLIGIGEVYAQAIIDARPFENINDLIKVYGIGEKTLEKIRAQGLACVNSNETEETDEPEPEIVESKEEDIEEPEIKDIEEPEEIETNKAKTNQSSDENKIIKLNSGKEIISLNPKQELNKVIYESKNEKMRNYGIYLFCLFLIFIIVILLLRK